MLFGPIRTVVAYNEARVLALFDLDSDVPVPMQHQITRSIITHIPDHLNSRILALEAWQESLRNVAVGHPLDTVKVRLQLDPSRFKGPIDCLVQTVRHEGLLGLYKGMAAPIVGVAAVNAVLFSSYGWFKELLGGRPKGGKWKNGRLLDDDLNIREIAAAGSAAGVVQAFITSPIDLVKIRLQAQYSLAAHAPLAQIHGTLHPHQGPLDVARMIIRNHGIKGLFHGTWATVVREIPAYAGFYGGFEMAKRALRNTLPQSKILRPDGLQQQQQHHPQQQQQLPVSRLMIAGAFDPLDVAKSRIQKLNPGEGSTSVLHALRAIFLESGFRGLFNGYLTSVIRSIPAAGATFTVYELTIRLFG